MSILQSFIEALGSLTANKMRSGLTTLGIMIGVAAVISMLGIGNGAQASITDQIDSLGTNLLYVTPGGEAANPEPLTLGDAQAIANPALAADVQYVAPIIQGQMGISVAGESSNTTVYAVTPEYFKVQTVELAEGQLISQMHLDGYAPVVLLGPDVAKELFGRTDKLVGKTVRLRGQIFTVIGVLEAQGGTGFGSSDNRILLPLSTAHARLLRRDEPDQVDMIYVQAASSEAVTPATEQVTRLLRSRHRISDNEDDFDILSTQMFLETASTVTGIMTAFLGGIAGVSLLVGGIGIMNIMLVTVVERTREIGLRKALGARRSSILAQFLVESAMLSLGGGIMGILLGYGIAALIGVIAAGMLNPVIKPDTVLLATLFSAAVGLFFGLYPASRAAKLEPVEALRSE